MAQFARVLALRYDSVRTRHSYYRHLRLLSEHFAGDPVLVTEEQLRDYLLHVKTVRRWQPKTVRQALATAQVFFCQQLGLARWRLFDQVKAKDHDTLPPVLTREQVKALLQHIRLRRYRTPLKLIYCCGLRLSECLNLTIHDVIGSEHKLRIRAGKGNKDRTIKVPMLPATHATDRAHPARMEARCPVAARGAKPRTAWRKRRATSSMTSKPRLSTATSAEESPRPRNHAEPKKSPPSADHNDNAVTTSASHDHQAAWPHTKPPRKSATHSPRATQSA